jgi:hypothetical protein
LAWNILPPPPPPPPKKSITFKMCLHVIPQFFTMKKQCVRVSYPVLIYSILYSIILTIGPT